MSTQVDTKPFGIKDKLGYMFGDFGNDFTFIFASSFLMVFYTKVLGISTEAVGVLFLVARCVDAFTDVTMGRIVDTFKPAKDGRFKPWIRRMCGPVALASFLMYQSALASSPMAVKMVYMYVTYILWGSVFYTSINIPYGSMASAISNDPSDRASLSTFRSVGASLASLIVGVGCPLILYSTDSAGNKIVEGGRFTIIAGVFSILAIVCYVLCYKLTTERIKVEPDPNKPKVSIIDTFGAMFKNRALLGIILAAIVLLLSQLLAQTVNNFLFADYFKNTAALSIMSMLGTVITLAVAPFIVPIIKKFGKKESGAVATLIAALAYLLLFVLRLKNAYAYVAIAAISTFGQSYFNLIIWANITDVIDHQEVQTHTRDDGTIYAVYSFARKIGQALAGGLGGFALGAIGYESAAIVQTEAVTNGLYTLATIIPAVCFLLVTLILAFLYPLSKKIVEENTAELAKRRNNKR